MAEHEPPKPEVLAQHRWLRQLVGEWVCTMEASEPGCDSAAPAVEKVRALGDTWIQGETQTEMPGMGTVVMQLTLGYDPNKQRFVGTWLGSMMNHLWVYEGDLDASGRVLTLDTIGPVMMGPAAGTMTKYQDVITIVSPNERTLTGRQQQPDGAWLQFMHATYKRKS